MPAKSTTEWAEHANALKIFSVLKEFAAHALETLLTTLRLKPVDAPQDIEIKEVSVLLDVELMKSSLMDNAAALLDSTPLMESADNAIGMKFMIKDLEYAEFLVMLEEFSISQASPAFAFLSTLSLLMEPVEYALYNQHTALLPRSASAMMASLKTLASAPLLAILMKDSLMENVFARMDTTLLDIHVVFAHLPYLMIQPTESAELVAKQTKSGMLPLDHADAFQDFILLQESVLNAILKLKFTTKDFNAVIASTDIKKFQDKDAMEFVDLSAMKIKIGFQEDAFASLDSSWLTISAQLAPMAKFMISTKEYAESNAEATKSIISIAENAIVLKDFILFKVPAQNVLQVSFMMSTLKLALLLLVKVLMNSTAQSPDNAFANLNMLELKESAPTAHLDTTMIATLTNASASLDSN